MSSEQSNDSFILSPELAEQIRKKAAALRQRPEDLLASLVQRYLDQEDAYVAAVREGLREIDEAKSVEFEDVKRNVRARLKHRSS